MRKRITGFMAAGASPEANQWLDLEQAVAEVELSSEDAAYPVENALLPGSTAGWRAAAPGPQTVRLRFGRPQRVSRIALEFAGNDLPRTQEFCLRWSADEGQTWRDIVRQQWNFSPEGASVEKEDYRVELNDATDLALEVVPDIAGGNAAASLVRMRLA